MASLELEPKHVKEYKGENPKCAARAWLEAPHGLVISASFTTSQRRA